MEAPRARSFPHQWALPESEGVMARLGKGRVEGLNFSPDRKRLAVASGVGLWLINMDDLTPAALWTGKAVYAGAVAFSPSGERLATGGVGAVHIWEAETGGLAESLETTPKHWVNGMLRSASESKNTNERCLKTLSFRLAVDSSPASDIESIK